MKARQLLSAFLPGLERYVFQKKNENVEDYRSKNL